MFTHKIRGQSGSHFCLAELNPVTIFRNTHTVLCAVTIHITIYPTFSRRYQPSSHALDTKHKYVITYKWLHKSRFRCTHAHYGIFITGTIASRIVSRIAWRTTSPHASTSHHESHRAAFIASHIESRIVNRPSHHASRHRPSAVVLSRRLCVCACMRVCVCAFVRVRICVCACVRAYIYVGGCRGHIFAAVLSSLLIYWGWEQCPVASLSPSPHFRVYGYFVFIMFSLTLSKQSKTPTVPALATDPHRYANKSTPNTPEGLSFDTMFYS